MPEVNDKVCCDLESQKTEHILPKKRIEDPAKEAGHNDRAGLSEASLVCLRREDEYGCHNYHPIPVVLCEGKGSKLKDVDGRWYFDFLSAYSAVNQGHCHPRIYNALVAQASQLSLTSRAFHSDMLGHAVEFLCKKFGYEKALMMNGGVEAVESSIKIARRWAYRVKGVEDDKAVVLVADSNFHGRTLSVVSFSTDPDCYHQFGPKSPGYGIVPYDDLEQLENVMKSMPNVCAYLFEPIQGEAGVVVPSEGYLKGVRSLCDKYNVLMIADEIQCGLGRAGHMLYSDSEGVRPDVVLLGKALSGGMMPISAVLADSKIMDVLTPGSHGSTFGGNPTACAVMMEALKVIEDENLCERSRKLGQQFYNRISKLQEQRPDLVETLRGRGLMYGLVIKCDERSPSNGPAGQDAWQFCLKLRDHGLLAKPTHKTIIRFTPPLVMTDAEMEEACDIIVKVASNFRM